MRWANEFFREEPVAKTQHSIDITPDLKADVEGGLPLSQAEGNQDRPKRIIMIEGKPVDLSSEVYDQAENESDEAYMDRIMDEVWAYLESPVAQKLWEQKNGEVKSRVQYFVNAVREFFKELLNYKGKNIDNATLEELLLSGATNLIQGKYLESKAVAENESKKSNDDGIQNSINRNEVNSKFNNDLMAISKNTVSAPNVLELGKPHSILLSTGIPNLPIQLKRTVLNRKSNSAKHEYDKDILQDLPKLLNNPIMVYDYPTEKGGKVSDIAVEIEHNGRTVLVGLLDNKKAGVLEVNAIKNIFPLSNEALVKIIADKKVEKYVEKEKGLKLINAWYNRIKDNRTNSTQSNNPIANIDNLYNKAIQSLNEHQNPISNTEIRFSIMESGRAQIARKPDLLPLTLTVFKRPEFKAMQGKQIKPISIQQSLNQTGIKQLEKQLINDILDTEFKDQKAIYYDTFEASVRANLMPLQRIHVGRYSEYGMDNLGEDENYGDHETIIFNAPVEHGQEGHFSGEMKYKKLDNTDYEIKQLNDTTWVAIDKNRPANADQTNIMNYVGTAGSKASVEQWVATRNDKDREGTNVGMFAHIRVWHNTDTGVYTLAEAQSDYFQKNNARKDFINKNSSIINKKTNEYISKYAEEKIKSKYTIEYEEYEGKKYINKVIANSEVLYAHDELYIPNTIDIYSRVGMKLPIKKMLEKEFETIKTNMEVCYYCAQSHTQNILTNQVNTKAKDYQIKTLSALKKV